MYIGEVSVLFGWGLCAFVVFLCVLGGFFVTAA